MPSFLYLLVLDPKLRKLRYRCALVLFAAIVAMGSVPGARAEIGNLAPGVVLHSLAYAALSFLLFTGFAGTARERAIKTVLAVMAMGACDELVQSRLPYRVGTVADWMVDCSAALVTSGLLWAFLPNPAPAR